VLKLGQYFAYSLLLLISVPCSAQEKPDLLHAEAKDTDHPPETEDITLRNAAIFFASVAQHVQENYVEAHSYNKLLEGALNGMLSSLDPHSGYFTPAKYQELKNQTNGEFGGLGIEVSMEDGFIKVVSPIEDTPAFHAGLQPGDLIVRIENEPVYGMTLFNAVEKLQGKPGTGVTFTIRRNGISDFEVNITRAIIHVQPVKTKIEGDIGVIRITTFNEDTTQEVIKAVHEIKAQIGDKLQGVVLDLRNNAGGLFNQSVTVANLFLDKGRIVSIKSRSAETKAQNVDANPEDMLRGLPMAVLINSGSASSSEIVAGALQDQKRAIVVGTKSFGKGSVQTVIPLSNGGAIKLTTALYYTPNGRSIQKTGIEPDIKIEQATGLKLVDESDRLKEADFRSALENGNKKVPTTPAKVVKKDKTGKEEVIDYQLLRAVDILRGINFYKKGG
jgi:carboxyl-terminal processing protease